MKMLHETLMLRKNFEATWICFKCYMDFLFYASWKTSSRQKFAGKIGVLFWEWCHWDRLKGQGSWVGCFWGSLSKHTDQVFNYGCSVKELSWKHCEDCLDTVSALVSGSPWLQWGSAKDLFSRLCPLCYIKMLHKNLMLHEFFDATWIYF